MNYHEIIVNALNYLQGNYTTILAYLGAGGGISVVLQLLKRLRNWERDAWIQLVLAVFTVATTTADYIINNQTTGAVPTIFGDMTPKLLVAAMIMHRIAVSPLTKLIEKQIQGMVNRAAIKAANSVTVTGNIIPHSITAATPTTPVTVSPDTTELQTVPGDGAVPTL